MHVAKMLAAVAAVVAFAAAQAAAGPAPIGVGGLPHAGNQEEDAVAKDLGLKVIRMLTSQGMKDEEGRNKPRTMRLRRPSSSTASGDGVRRKGAVPCSSV